MSDLISRKEALERLQIIKKINTAKIIQDCIDAAYQQINNCKIAFNKEKVLSKLKEKYNYSHKVYVELSLHPEHDDSCIAYWDGIMDAYKEAIEIVKKGGIE